MVQAEDSPPLFRPRTTLLIAALLAIPLLIDLATRQEVYPSVILPSGGHVLKNDDGRSTFSATQVVAFDSGGQMVEISAAELLGPIPRHYLRYLAAVGFGVGEKPDHEIRVRRLGTVRLGRPQPSATERRQAAQGLRDRLDSLGLDNSRFVVRSVRITVDVSSGDEVERVVTNEAFFDL